MFIVRVSCAGSLLFSLICVDQSATRILIEKNGKKLKKPTYPIRIYFTFVAISMTWVVLGHSIFVPMVYGTVSNALNVFETWPLNFLSQTILNGLYSVDSFFFISGALLSYLFFKKNAKIHQLPMMVLCRWIRLTVR